MTDKTKAYAPGDWIVHLHHGVGQIEGNETKVIRERENTYCKIKTRDSTFWIPTDKLKDEWLRPLASPADIKQALEALGSPPRTMDADPTKRNNQIKKAKLNYSPLVMAKMIRDLWEHKKMKKTFPTADMDALRYFTDRFLTEWSVCMNLEMEAVEQQLNEILAGS